MGIHFSRYRLSGDAGLPAGYVGLLANGRPLAVPEAVAAELLQAVPPGDDEAPAPQAGAPARRSRARPAPYAAPRAAPDPHAVEWPDRRWRRPRGRAGGAVQVWSPAEMRGFVDAHNARQAGSADPPDRSRLAALLRMLVAAGPWRLGAGPADGQQARDAVAAELEHVGAGALARIARQALTLARARGEPLRLGNVLLVGQPGVGKTWAAQRLAALLSLPCRTIDAAALQTNSVLAGSDRHWSNAAPGLLFELVVLGAAPNPVLVIDEIDKISRGARYDPLQPLHASLERETSRRVRDLAVPQLAFDASWVSYVATANTLKGLPDSLLSRFHIVHCPAPTPAAALAIARQVWREVTQGLAPLAGVELPRELGIELATMTPRAMRRVVDGVVAEALDRRDVDGFRSPAPSKGDSSVH